MCPWLDCFDQKTGFDLVLLVPRSVLQAEQCGVLHGLLVLHVARRSLLSPGLVRPPTHTHTERVAAQHSTKNGKFSIINTVLCCCIMCEHPPWQQLIPFFALHHADVTLCLTSLRALCGHYICMMQRNRWKQVASRAFTQQAEASAEAKNRKCFHFSLSHAASCHASCSLCGWGVSILLLQTTRKLFYVSVVVPVQITNVITCV